jgi:hypothetical protein
VKAAELCCFGEKLSLWKTEEHISKSPEQKKGHSVAMKRNVTERNEQLLHAANVGSGNCRNINLTALHAQDIQYF